MALALAQRPEGFSGWWGNVAWEAPGDWALNLVAEFPSLITHLLQFREAENKVALLCLIPGQGILAGGAQAWCLCVLTNLNTCCPAHMWLRLTDQLMQTQSLDKLGRRVMAEVSMSWALKVEAEDRKGGGRSSEK